MDTWDEYLVESEREHQIQALLDKFILFFQKDGEIYGAGEDSRVVFAKMKNPDDELPTSWEDEASFSAHDLKKMLKGDSSYHLFKKSDLKDIKIIDREVAVKKLDKEEEPQTQPTQISIVKVGQNDRDSADNFVRTDEE